LIASILRRINHFSPKYRRLIGRILAFTFVIALSVFIFSLRNRAEEIATYGYPGIFLFSVLTSATVILPAPGLLIVFTIGGVLNPIWIALAAGTGAALGELSGYLAGYSGREVVENTETYDRIREFMENHNRLSNWLIFFLAFIPIPIFDLAGIAAGALKMPVLQFLAWVTAGKILKMLLVAYLGAATFELFL